MPEPHASTGDTGAFDPAGFISQLVSISLEAAAESERRFAALRAGQGRASEGPVEIVVAPTGEVRSLTFQDEPSAHPAKTIEAAVMRAYRRAAAAANAATAAGADPSVAGTIIASVPGEVAAQRAEEDLDPTGPALGEDAPRPRPGTDVPPTVADLPADPGLDALLSILDDPDPFRAVERLRTAPGLPRVDLRGRTAADIDAEIRAEVEAISERGAALGPELRSLRATARNADGEVEVDAWGGLTGIELSVGVRTRTAEELEESLTGLIADATVAASRRAPDLLRGTPFDDPADPVVADLMSKDTRGSRDE
jgi:hypothetical protein